MKIFRILRRGGFLILFLNAFTLFGAGLAIPSNIDHKAWDELLRKYVDSLGLVDYNSWKNDPQDLQKLDRYLLQFSPAGRHPAQGNDLVASLINAYNAFTIQWILENYPTESILLLENSWTEPRHRLGGENHSLDEIENIYLRDLIGWKMHAVLVCAARSCPPLKPSAYPRNSLSEDIEEAYRRWLGRIDLNRFNPYEKKIEVSKIFDWFKEDFEKGGGLERILLAYAPQRYKRFIQSGDYTLEYKEYRWGLNDRGGRGLSYEAGPLDLLLQQ